MTHWDTPCFTFNIIRQSYDDSLILPNIQACLDELSESVSTPHNILSHSIAPTTFGLISMYIRQFYKDSLILANIQTR